MSSDEVEGGLCAVCEHCRLVRTPRSTFYLCARSFADERFPRYPPLPVRACIGHESGSPSDFAGPPPTPAER